MQISLWKYSTVCQYKPVILIPQTFCHTPRLLQTYAPKWLSHSMRRFVPLSHHIIHIFLWEPNKHLINQTVFEIFYNFHCFIYTKFFIAFVVTYPTNLLTDFFILRYKIYLDQRIFVSKWLLLWFM